MGCTTSSHSSAPQAKQAPQPVPIVAKTPAPMEKKKVEPKAPHAEAAPAVKEPETIFEEKSSSCFSFGTFSCFDLGTCCTTSEDLIFEKASKAIRSVEAYFPEAKRGKCIVEEVMSTLETLGITAENTLYAQSVCPDEINHHPGDITNLFCEALGEVFHLGGLAGIPFTGKTGFDAFSHHVPDSGNLFVLMAPHIGVNSSGELGMYTREGQTNESTACGAAVGAYTRCCSMSEEKLRDIHDPALTTDYQMHFITHKIAKRFHEIHSKPGKNEVQAELALQTYGIGQKFLDEVVHTKFGAGKLVVLSGIQINMPKPMYDYFQPLAFYVLQKNQSRVDLLPRIVHP